ncbi:hypothetical protein ACJRO7_024436 [Eucalyptus globulus]|uniref:Polygalacturonase n=1 Tax=Eucalyptus globulus TaxID=34317 RepID=A0ABD3K7I7_EUCGL
MGFSISICSLILVSALLLTSEIKVGVADKTFSVLDYVAVGNGITDDSSAFTKAWNDACNTDGEDKWLTFNSVNGLNISGLGSFDAYGASWWNNSCSLSPKPTLTINYCNDISLQHLYFKNSPQMHLVVSGSSNVYLRSLDIYAPEWSPNTDGIHIGGSHGVVVRASTIGTGRASLSSDSDDCISITDQTSNITISDIKCGPGHGISIGSLGQDGSEVSVSKIKVKNVNFHGSTNGARIKTWQVGRGQVSQVDFSNLNFTAVENPIIIDQYYCNTPGNCPKTNTVVHIDDVHFRNAFGTSSTEVAINLKCSDNVACTNIILDTIKLESAIQGKETISSCNNAFETTEGIVKPKSCL